MSIQFNSNRLQKTVNQTHEEHDRGSMHDSPQLGQDNETRRKSLSSLKRLLTILTLSIHPHLILHSLLPDLQL